MLFDSVIPVLVNEVERIVASDARVQHFTVHGSPLPRGHVGPDQVSTLGNEARAKG